MSTLVPDMGERPANSVANRSYVRKYAFREGGYSFQDLFDMSEEIRLIMTEGKSLTIKDYRKAIVPSKIHLLGYRKSKAIMYENKLV